AIVGTGQIGNNELVTDTPIDALATQLPANNAERSLLLTAGALAVYRQAGYCTESAPAIPQLAPAEVLASCSAKAALLLANLLQGEHSEVLPEALEQLQKAHLRLPHDSLPQALAYGTRNKQVRTALVPVIGERGRWLSQFNQEWKWVNQLLLEAEKSLPANAETIWQEGSLEQRCMVLRNIREIDPTKARDWLAEVWKQEKAETRTAFITTFEVNLSLEDEPFLEKALDDRSTNVQSIAISLLAHIPGSTLAQRMQVRADAILTYTKGKITITPLETIDEHWKQDGLDKDGAAKTSTLQQIISLVAPSHWEERFGMIPEKLISALKKDEELMMLEAWSQAALLYNATNWILPLLDMWHHSLKKSKNHTDLEPAIQMIARLPQQEAEEIIAHLLFENIHWHSALTVLAQPWSHNFGEACLQALQDHVRRLKKNDPDYYEWNQILDIASIALSESCFERALQPWEMPEEEKNGWVISYWRNNLTDFSEVIKIRKQILEEIR
ncbi:MAG TPA: DUF5691 domain-containing protein, partial [Ktedonobacteraceae bacterium]|nr:DUF5691 domain-containing protein [Ktedonobacteraceae bacterium]